MNVHPRLLIAVLCVALAARVGVLIVAPQPLSTDPDGYWQLASNLAHHGTLGHNNTASAYRPPVYPLLLTPCALLGDLQPGSAAQAAVAVLHVVLGVATLGLVFALGVRLSLGRWSAVAALLVAFDPILLNQSTLIMTETPAAFFAAAALFAVDVVLRRPTILRAAALGLLWAVAALCRPVFLPWLVLGTVLLFVVLKTKPCESQGGKSGRGRTCVVLSTSLAALAVLAIWTVRNQLQFGRPILTTTHGGYTLYLANNPWFYNYLANAPWGDVWDAKELGPQWNRRAEDLLIPAPAMNLSTTENVANPPGTGEFAVEQVVLEPSTSITPQQELADDRAAYAAAFSSIRDQPGMFFYSCLVRVGRLWAVLPHQVSGRWLVAAWYCLEYLLAAVGVWAICRHGSHRSPLWLWALLLVACVTAIHTFYWTNMRMRAPLVPIIALTAAAGLSCLYQLLIDPAPRRVAD